MSYTRDSANDLVWDEGSQSYTPASVPPTPTLAEYTCDRDTTLDIYESALDPDTVYNVTDQQDSFINIIRDTIWPVGSLYLGMMEVCPLAALFGTWVKVSSGRVLQGADDNHLAGTAIEAGLPNITGETRIYTEYNLNNTEFANRNKGAFYYDMSNDSASDTMGTSTNMTAGTNDTIRQVTFDASRSSSIYGNSDTVQPPAFCVNIWQRIA